MKLNESVVRKCTITYRISKYAVIKLYLKNLEYKCTTASLESGMRVLYVGIQYLPSTISVSPEFRNGFPNLFIKFDD